MTSPILSTSPDGEILDLLSRWAGAELHGNTDAYASLLDAKFRGIGPVGFVLEAQQWVGRHQGDLVNRRYDVTDARVRRYGSTAVIDAVVGQETSAMGRDTSGSFRVGVVAVNGDQGWVLAQVQFSGPLIDPDQVPPFARETARAGGL